MSSISANPSTARLLIQIFAQNNLSSGNEIPDYMLVSSPQLQK
jgi:hypothetical protein